jgi:hypothetical protein
VVKKDCQRHIAPVTDNRVRLECCADKVLPITPYVVNSIPMKQQNRYNENNDGNFQCQTVGNVARQLLDVFPTHLHPSNG